MGTTRDTRKDIKEYNTF